MRIWDVDPSVLCRVHLLGEHRELHALWTILTQDKKGYRMHPETKRWEGKLKALYKRHGLLVIEMEKRGYTHASDLETHLATGSDVQDVFLHTLDEQREMLRTKQCTCFS